MSFWRELRRRNVVKVGVAYLVAAWLLAQVVGLMLPTFNAPEWVAQTIIFLLILGFPIVLIIAWAFEITPDGIRPTSKVSQSESIPSITGHRLNYVVTGLLACAVVFLAVGNYFVDRSGEVSGTDDDTRSVEQLSENPQGVNATPADDEILPNSIAVLPLENLSPNPDDRYYADGIHVEIINQLSKLGELTVIGRDSVLPFAGGATPMQEIATALRVSSILRGSFQYVDGRIRIVLSLIDPVSGTTLLPLDYQDSFADIFSVQADIATKVADALAIGFSLEEQREIERAPTDSPEAYAYYLQALSLSGGGGTEDLIALLDQALDMDEAFVSAHQLQSMFHADALVNTTSSDAIGIDERERHVELARRHAQRAADLDPSLAWLPATVDALPTWHWSQALSALDSAPDPLDNPSIWLHSYVGEHEKAIERARRAVALDPRSWVRLWTLSVALAYAGEMSESERVFREAIELTPAVPVLHSWLAFVEIAQGDEESAATELERVERQLGQNRQAVFLPELAYSYSRIGRRADVERIAAEVRQVSDSVEIGSGGWAMVYLASDDRERAAEHLEAAIDKIENHEIDEGLWNLMNIRMNVTSDPVLEEPRFVELRNRLRGD